MRRALTHFTLLLQLLLALVNVRAFAATVPQGDAKTFLTSSVSDTRPYVGEEVLLTYTLYFRETAPKISDEVTPSLRGLWAKEAKPERYIKSTPATFRGQSYRCAVIKRFRLVPVQAGTLTVSGYSMNCAVPSGKPAAGGAEPPDIIAQITAPPVTIEAKPLPGTPPPGFSGAVGSFSLELLADKQNVHAGDPLTLKIRVYGTGSLLTLTLPPLKLPDSFRPGTSEVTNALQSESAVSSGSTTSTIVVWPQSPGNFAIEPVRMVVFDLEAGTFHTLESKPLSVIVGPATGNAGAGPKPVNGPVPPVAPGPEKNNAAGTPFSFIAVIAAVVLAAAVVIFFLKKRPSSVSGETVSEVPSQTGDSPQAIKKLVFELVEKAGINGAAGLTRNQLKAELQNKTEITEEQLDELTGLLDTIDRILFTSSATREGGLPGDSGEKIERLRKALKTRNA
ncbi:MAG: protein BatD [Chlorobiaceae bacterium]|nr:protein BatD [Chlorobiaceae bacterium]